VPRRTEPRLLKSRWSFSIAFLIVFCGAICNAQNSTTIPHPPAPDVARIAIINHSISLSNSVLKITWRIADGRLIGQQFENRITHRVYSLQRNPFVILLAGNGSIGMADMRIVGMPLVTELSPEKTASRRADRLSGKLVAIEFEDRAATLHVTWQALLRDDSDYIQQKVTLSAKNTAVQIEQVRLIDWDIPGARVEGTVKGSPVVTGDLFFGIEHPLSECVASFERAQCKMERALPLEPSRSVTYSSVIGVAQQGRIRRFFLNYLERERAHPYRSFLHYNSWYDLGDGGKYDEAAALDAINALGSELTRKRGIRLASFLFDDGWDDPDRVWKFNSGFPQGFANVSHAATQFGSASGVWMSPWGGYGKTRESRVAAGKAAGYETVGDGFALSGPNYYRLFHDTCLKMIRDFGVNQFKFDGTGNAKSVVSGSEFDSDFDAAIHLIDDIRAEKPDVYVNLTTGTQASPFWLLYADSIWRGGEDNYFSGVGTKREQWITYRDAETYQNVVLKAPLYPLNSLMLHGLIYARYADGLNSDANGDFQNEVRSYFGSGTQLQELYVTPALLSQADWDNLAEAARWSNDNADVLVDTHWVGGDPRQLEVYGWAACNSRKGILVLRNPSDTKKALKISLNKAFELPLGSSRFYRLHSPWKEDQKQSVITLRSNEPRTFELKPFEVMVLDASAVDSTAAGYRLPGADTEPLR
jgi:hypothetical protein